MDALKEPAISHTIIGWTKDWEKDKWNTDGAVNKVLFSNHYNNLHFVSPETGHVYYIQEEDAVFQRHYGRFIHAWWDVPGVEEDEVKFFLAKTSLHKTPQADGVKVMHPEQGSDHDRVWDPNEEK